MSRIGFIGAGNMAGSIIGGLLNAGYRADSIRAADPAPTDRSKQLGIELLADNQAIADWADVIILAVKPQVLKPVCTQIAAQVGRRQNLIISIAAGIRSDNITAWLGAGIACIRVMPNIPATIRLGASGLYANPHASDAQINVATDIMQTIGKVIRFNDEAMIDAVTAVSGSGPAYFFVFMEALVKAATQQGLTEAEAKSLVLQTALGAVTMATRANVDMEELRRRVTSPGGTTESAIQVLLEADFMRLISRAVDAAGKRSVALSDELSTDD